MDPGSLNIHDIEKIISSMNPGDIQQLQDMAAAFFAPGDNGSEKSKKNTGKSPQDTEPSLDLETVNRIMRIINKLKSQPPDPRCQLIAALKPMLSPPRQKKADEAINILHMMQALPMIKELF
ncbi:MAG: hypothetical protein PUC33_06510 [Oscillospiraceae bacterium]|nr:hypothetical protein [Oscillospiraceae bacterium]